MFSFIMVNLWYLEIYDKYLKISIMISFIFGTFITILQ